MVVLDTDRSRSLEIARTGDGGVPPRAELPQHPAASRIRRRRLRRQWSERLVDAIVVQGHAGAIRERVQAHFHAGADHVCAQLLTDTRARPEAAWRELATALAEPGPAST
jgi:2-methylisocitrate lyase-like PEP mutase family enzyme